MHTTPFRQYDIRGKVGTELCIENMYRLGQAIAAYMYEKKPDVHSVAVGRDGRTHSLAIQKELIRALQDAGLDVVDIGLTASPVLYYYTHIHDVDAGLMITASHNPKEYNGIKMVLAKESIWGSGIALIEQYYHKGIYYKGEKKGAYSKHDINEEYVDFLVSQFSHLKGMKISALIDCGNGAGGTVIPLLVEKMNWAHVDTLYAEVDGTYPYHEADPTVIENMKDVQSLLAKGTYDLGAGIDGDADRMAVMTADGYLVPGDQLLAVFAHDVVTRNPGAAVVFDIKSSQGLVELLEKWGARPIMSPSGHSNIKHDMKKHDALLAGELSCHFFFKDQYFGYDDGVYALLRLFSIMKETGKSLDQLVSVFPEKYSSREYRIALEDEKKQDVIDYLIAIYTKNPDALLSTLDGIRITMPYGWFIVRASNTQPVLSMRFEGNSPQDLDRIKQDVIQLIKPYFKPGQLAIMNE